MTQVQPTITKTQADTDRTQASVVHYPNGQRNVVMQGPLAEIISRALYEYYRHDGDSNAIAFSSESADSFGAKFYMERAGQASYHVYSCPISSTGVGDIIEFARMLGEASEHDQCVLLLISAQKGEAPNSCVHTLITQAKLAGAKTYTSAEQFFTTLFGAPVQKEQPVHGMQDPAPTFDRDDLSIEALDAPRAPVKRTVKGASAAFIQNGDAMQSAKAAEAALSDIEQLAKQLKHQADLYQRWSIQAAQRLQNASPEQYEQVAKELQASRPKSPAELVSERQFNWPALGAFELAGTTEKSGGEVVFKAPEIEVKDADHEVVVTAPQTEQERTFIQSVKQRVDQLIEYIKDILSDSEQATEKLEQASEQIKQKDKKDEQGRPSRARVHTHPKTVEATSSSVFSDIGGYLSNMAKFLGTIAFTE